MSAGMYYVHGIIEYMCPEYMYILLLFTIEFPPVYIVLCTIHVTPYCSLSAYICDSTFHRELIPMQPLALATTTTPYFSMVKPSFPPGLFPILSPSVTPVSPPK